MRRLMATVFGTCLGIGIAYVAFEYHLVRSESEYVFIPKPQASLVDSYADIREWDISQWKEHRELAKAISAHGRSDLIKQSVTEDLLDRLFGNTEGAQRSQPGSHRN